MIYIELAFMSLAMACVCSFLIIVGRKTGALEWLQIRTPTWFPWGCEFCLGWWLSLIFTTLVFTFWLQFEIVYVLIPVMSTVFNNKLLK